MIIKNVGNILTITDENIEPIRTATSLLVLINQLFPRQFKWEENNYRPTFGSNELRILSAKKRTLITYQRCGQRCV